MAGTRYLVRFDDVCPTMNWSVWDYIEQLLLELDIKPIIAIVPNNKDEKLDVMEARADFWDKARFWQSNKWCIALHGYEHRYETTDSGLVGVKNASEFAGLPYDIQKKKLQAALEIFEYNRVKADAWVAPSHSFDRTTVQLLVENGLNIISDGYYFRPVRYLNAIWIPQQMWRFRSMPMGVWTICYHLNSLSERDIIQIENDFRHYQKSITNIHDFHPADSSKPRTSLDCIFNKIWLSAVKLRRRFRF
jgi:predicted deacetylase